MTKVQAIVAGAIRTQVERFSDRRLDDGDDVWHERELELRCAVAATANAIFVALKSSGVSFVAFKTEDVALDVVEFAAACGLHVSDGRDCYSDCCLGELTWEPPIKEAPRAC